MSGLGGGGETAPKMAPAPPRRRTARGEGRGGGGGGLLSRSGRLLRSPSSLALTEGPAAPWGGLRTLVGDGGPFRPLGGGTLRGCGLSLGLGGLRSVGGSPSARPGKVFTEIRPSQDLFFPL